jgi:hypothetical protein
MATHLLLLRRVLALYVVDQGENCFYGLAHDSPDRNFVVARPTPHLNKLQELTQNAKLPDSDRPRVEAALTHYREWIAEMEALKTTGEQKVVDLVAALNRYKKYVELELIWDSPSEFLYRQKGQLKLDNSIIEEFLPWLADEAIVPELKDTAFAAGPRKAFAAAYFLMTPTSDTPGAGLTFRTKDQDFAVSRPVFIKASLAGDFPSALTTTQEASLTFVAAECKTNLDKTMLQEAIATAHDLKVALPGARYYVICEYLDMKPISTAGTDIDEVLILRGRRVGSDERKDNAKPEFRRAKRDERSAFLDKFPVRTDVVLRFVAHLRSLFAETDPEEKDVIARGYF